MSKDPNLVNFDGFDLLDSLFMPIVLVNKNTEIIYVNDCAEDFFMASKKTLKKLLLNRFFFEKQKIISLIEKVYASHRPFIEYDVGIKSYNGINRCVDLYVAPYLKKNDYFVLWIHNKTVLQILEKSVDFSRFSTSVTHMTALLAHEIKNPLSGIKGAAQLLQPSLKDEDKELTGLICDEVERIEKLVNKTSMLSDQSLQIDTVNIYSVLDYVKQIAEKGFASHIVIKTEYDPSVPLIYADKDLLIQTFINIVKNSAEAIGSDRRDGVIVIKVGYASKVIISNAKQNSATKLPLHITIKDNGGGIENNIKLKLFVPFSSTKPRGKGLGLALCAKIIDRHGGVIDIVSKNNETNVNIYLPLKVKIIK